MISKSVILHFAKAFLLKVQALMLGDGDIELSHDPAPRVAAEHCQRCCAVLRPSPGGWQAAAAREAGTLQYLLDDVDVAETLPLWMRRRLDALPSDLIL